MAAVSNGMIEHILSLPPNENIKHLLIGLLPTIGSMDEKPDTIGKFFISEKY